MRRDHARPRLHASQVIEIRRDLRRPSLRVVTSQPPCRSFADDEPSASAARCRGRSSRLSRASLRSSRRPRSDSQSSAGKRRQCGALKTGHQGAVQMWPPKNLEPSSGCLPTVTRKIGPKLDPSRLSNFRESSSQNIAIYRQFVKSGRQDLNLRPAGPQPSHNQRQRTRPKRRGPRRRAVLTGRSEARSRAQPIGNWWTYEVPKRTKRSKRTLVAGTS